MQNYASRKNPTLNKSKFRVISGKSVVVIRFIKYIYKSDVRTCVCPQVSSVELLCRPVRIEHLNCTKNCKSCEEAEFLRFQTTDRPHIECIIPQAVLHSLMLLRTGKIIARNMSS
jgi:hypothetical protein